MRTALQKELLKLHPDPKVVCDDATRSIVEGKVATNLRKLTDADKADNKSKPFHENDHFQISKRVELRI